MDKYKLKDIVSFQNGFAFNSKDMGTLGTNIIKIKEVKNNKITITESTQKISNYDYDSMKNYIVKYDDILIALTGDPINKGSVESWVGRTAIYREKETALLNQRMCKIIPNTKYILQKYLYYYLISYPILYTLASSAKGSANQANISHKDVGKLEILLPSISEQQHIVDIIGSIDDKIENNNKILEKTDKLGVIKYKLLNDTFDEFCNFAIFKKGKEALSQNYTEENNNDNINFIRVKDLNSLTNTYIPKNLNIPIANPSDILISFDGAIGRINYGLYGAYSSGIYKVIPCFKNNYGILYWALKDNYNQRIMLEHTNGTTILHGAKAIPYLKIKKHSSKDIDFYNNIFNYSLNIKLENIKLNILKQLYLKKFFR